MCNCFHFCFTKPLSVSSILQHSYMHTPSVTCILMHCYLHTNAQLPAYSCTAMCTLLHICVHSIIQLAAYVHCLTLLPAYSCMVTNILLHNYVYSSTHLCALCYTASCVCALSCAISILLHGYMQSPAQLYVYCHTHAPAQLHETSYSFIHSYIHFLAQLFILSWNIMCTIPRSSIPPNPSLIFWVPKLFLVHISLPSGSSQYHCPYPPRVERCSLWSKPSDMWRLIERISAWHESIPSGQWQSYLIFTKTYIYRLFYFSLHLFTRVVTLITTHHFQVLTWWKNSQWRKRSGTERQ